MIGVRRIIPVLMNYPSFLVSKATLDIICETAFGYKADSLHNPENELAVAYERLLDLQNGKLTKRDAGTVVDITSRVEHRKIHHVLIHSWFSTAADNFLDV
jgi:hypothetical protein